MKNYWRPFRCAIFSVYRGISVDSPPTLPLQSSTINAVNIDSQEAAVICWTVVFWIFFTAFQHAVLVLSFCCFVFCHFCCPVCRM